MILSVSRRTDIPAFYSDWFFESLDAGFVLVPNPINPQSVARIELSPARVVAVQTNMFEDGATEVVVAIKDDGLEYKGGKTNKAVEVEGNIEGIVFWTKNPAPMLSKLEKLKYFAYYFLYTLNPYPSHIEANLPNLEKRIESFKKLSEFCPVIWWYDPILIADGIDIGWHIREFSKLCAELKGYTKHCKISFLITSYSGCSKSLRAPNEQEKHQILSAFSRVAKANGIQIEACALGEDYSCYEILPSKCIDGAIFEKLLTEKYADLNLTVKRKNSKIDGQRKFCGCMPAIDIGRYDTCLHGCTYCYARKGTQKSMLDPPTGKIYVRSTQLEFGYT